MFSAYDSSAILEASQEHTARTCISTADQKQLTQTSKVESDTTSATDTVKSLNHYEVLLNKLNNVVTRDG
jgi:hypothetical protein